ncbi:putative integrase, catalytic region [Brucella grignonensis]|uniref:Putative integrase, catalytic region n=1 Tax=Brucella grignonensis TaxID=94627 RepID=A0A256FN60_9HYPH|nr:putative integrase, catalytic region [Brucella grignonensis]
MGLKERRSTVLAPVEEAAIVALRVQARLPLDDVYIALKDVIPHLSRSSLHRCLQPHGISHRPRGDREKLKKFKIPYEAIQEFWKSKPAAFIVNPHYHIMGPDT